MPWAPVSHANPPPVIPPQEFELVRHEFALSHGGGALRPHERTDGEGEYALAVAGPYGAPCSDRQG